MATILPYLNTKNVAPLGDSSQNLKKIGEAAIVSVDSRDGRQVCLALNLYFAYT